MINATIHTGKQPVDENGRLLASPFLPVGISVSNFFLGVGINAAFTSCESITDQCATFARYVAGCGGSLNVVIAHDGGFLVGDDLGQLLVFEREKRRNSSVSTNRQVAGGRSDAYTCTRVLRLFDVGLVELQSGVGSSNGSVSHNVRGKPRAVPTTGRYSTHDLGTQREPCVASD